MSDSLKARLAHRPILVAPGCYDGLSALLIEQAGFEAAYLSGASIAYTRFGRPDLGLVGMNEIATTVGLIRDRAALPLIVDGDTGWGNALNVQRTVRSFARAGADAVQLEDQEFPKRCGHLADKRLISAGEMVGKLKAAVDARPSEAFLVIARTDAAAVDGFPAALERAERYLEAGADVLFIEAPTSLDELAAAGQRFGARVPLMANMVEGGRTPLAEAATLEAMGYALVIFPGGIVRLIARQAQAYLASLREAGTTLPFADRMFDFDGLNRVIGTPEMLAAGQRYAAPEEG